MRIAITQILTRQGKLENFEIIEIGLFDEMLLGGVLVLN